MQKIPNKTITIILIHHNYFFTGLFFDRILIAKYFLVFYNSFTMKKVIFLLFIGAMIGYVMKSNNVIPKNIEQMLPTQFQSHKEVAGVSTSALPKDFSIIQKELDKLPVSAIATSSPEGQALIHWLQKLPKDQLKAICQNRCGAIQ